MLARENRPKKDSKPILFDKDRETAAHRKLINQNKQKNRDEHSVFVILFSLVPQN